MKSPTAITALILCFATSLACGAEPRTEQFEYKTTPQAKLKLTGYFPADWQASDRRPAIVFFFGGGWNGGSTKQFEPQAKHFAQRGMVAFCADYRVKSRHGVTPKECVEDAKSAMRYVRQNAQKLGVDADRIVGAGGSAGGHLAACTALCSTGDAPDEDSSISSRPNLLVLFNPVLNYDGPKLLLEGLKQDEEAAKLISPTRHLTKDAPDALLFYGTKDEWTKQGHEFMQRSKELGHRAEIELADGVGHGFFNNSPWREKTLARADAFLVEHGYLSQNDHQLYEGTWRVVALTVNGKPVAEQDAKKISVVNGADGSWTILVDGKKISSGGSTIDPTQSPKTIDFTPADGDNQGKRFLGIYEISPDHRQLCFAMPGGARPKEFSSTEKNKFVWVKFEREKTAE